MGVGINGCVGVGGGCVSPRVESHGRMFSLSQCIERNVQDAVGQCQWVEIK